MVCYFLKKLKNNFILIFVKMLNLLIENKDTYSKQCFGILINLERKVMTVNLLDSLFLLIL